MEIIKIGGIHHTKVLSTEFNYAKAIMYPKLHPLGSVYIKTKYSKFGYVANGYNWWKFEIKVLQQINDNF